MRRTLFPGGNMSTQIRPRSWIPIVLVSMTLVRAAPARAEASHHQGSSSAQVVPVGVDGLTGGTDARWSLRVFGSFLTADRRFDGGGERVVLSGGGRVDNLAMNLLVERRLGDRWAVSALAAAQRLAITSPDAPVTNWGLGDSFVASRCSLLPRSWGSVLALGTVKIPGTYPEGEGTGAKQVDVEGKALLSLPRLGGPWASLIVGLGYKLRLGAIEDEIAPTVLLDVRPAAALRITLSLTGGIAVGLGSQPKDTLAPGLAVGWQFGPRLDVWAAYYRTVYGRNVVDAHIAVAGVGLSI